MLIPRGFVRPLLTLCIIPGVLYAAPSERPSWSGAAGPISPHRTPVTDDVWSSVLGSSQSLRAIIGTAQDLKRDPRLGPLLEDPALTTPGVHVLDATVGEDEPIVLVTLAPFGSATGPRQQGYHVGRWPQSGTRGGLARYAPPAGYIPVTAENASTRVSKHFQLSDFLTHDQQAVWPKVLVLQPVLVDKLELIRDELERKGLPSRLHVMSGFRTPQYNALGVGEKGGRAGMSRHMYGDAADVFVDGDANGIMDDLDRDGRVTVRDAQVLFAIAEGVEQKHPSLVGGLSAYRATAAHGPFVHVDTRGTRARW